MTTTAKKCIGLTVLAFSLALGLPAHAQNMGNEPPPPPPPGEDHRGFEHPEFREEMEKVHKEHEEIEAARDRLMEKCVNVSKEQAAVCRKEKEALHERAEKLHERMKAFHDKREAERKEHAEHHGEGKGERGHEHPPAPNGASGQPPAPQPPAAH